MTNNALLEEMVHIIRDVPYDTISSDFVSIIMTPKTNECWIVCFNFYAIYTFFTIYLLFPNFYGPTNTTNQWVNVDQQLS